MTKVSVIIPCLNGEPYLGPAVESLLNQTRPPDEIIVVDNGSTDGSLKTAKSFGGIVQAIHAPSGNACRARLEGYHRATGDALMFMDADDLLGPSALENLVEALERQPDAIACCEWRRLDWADNGWHSAPASCIPRRAWQDDLSAWLIGWYQPPCSVLWSRQAYERSGGWDPQVSVNQDGDVMMRGLAAGNRLVRAERGIAYYRRPVSGKGSLSGQRSTHSGLEAQLFVLRRLTGLLSERNVLHRYRGPLGEAYARIADQDIERFPDLADTHARDARYAAGLPWRRELRWHRARLARKAAHIRSSARAAFAPLPKLPEEPQAAAEEFDEDWRKPRRNGPLVSVVIPTFNRRELLQRALESVFAQTYENFEIVVVDDASTDGTFESVQRYGDPRLRYLRQETNQGVGAARNRGIRESSGELIAFLDSDDAWLPEKLAATVARFEESPRSVGLVYCGVETMDAESHPRHTDLPRFRGYVHDRLILKNFLVGGSCAAIRRSVVETVGYFDDTLPAIEDYEFWLRISRFYRFEYVAAPHVRYYDEITEGRGEERRSRSFIANFEARDKFHERNAHEMADAGVEHLFLLESAWRHLKWPYGNLLEGRALVKRALRKRPGHVALYPWLIYALLPREQRLAFAGTYRTLREALTFRAHSARSAYSRADKS